MDSSVVVDIADWSTGRDLTGYSCVPPNAKAAVLVVHGFGEYAMRHKKTMQRWAERGIATYAYDHRGHGNSPGKRATVESLDDLVDDALALREKVVAENPNLPVFLFGVSMGGLIATRSAQRSSAGLRGVVALAPAYAAAEDIPGFAQAILRGLRKIAPHMTLKPLTFDSLSRDPEIGKAYAVDPLTYHGGVPLCSGAEIIAGGEAAVADAPHYTVPTLILQGDADKIVFPIGATRFKDAAKSNRDLTLTVVPGGYHELFNDPGSEALVDSTAEWILSRA